MRQARSLLDDDEFVVFFFIWHFVDDDDRWKLPIGWMIFIIIFVGLLGVRDEEKKQLVAVWKGSALHTNTSRILFITLILYRSFSMFTHFGFFVLFYCFDSSVFAIVAAYVRMRVCLFYHFWSIPLLILFILFICKFFFLGISCREHWLISNRRATEKKSIVLNILRTGRSLFRLAHLSVAFSIYAPTHDMGLSPYNVSHKAKNALNTSTRGMNLLPSLKCSHSVQLLVIFIALLLPFCFISFCFLIICEYSFVIHSKMFQIAFLRKYIRMFRTEQKETEKMIS